MAGGWRADIHVQLGYMLIGKCIYSVHIVFMVTTIHILAMSVKIVNTPLIVVVILFIDITIGTIIITVAFIIVLIIVTVAIMTTAMYTYMFINL